MQKENKQFKHHQNQNSNARGKASAQYLKCKTNKIQCIQKP